MDMLLQESATLNAKFHIDCSIIGKVISLKRLDELSLTFDAKNQYDVFKLSSYLLNNTEAIHLCKKKKYILAFMRLMEETTLYGPTRLLLGLFLSYMFKNNIYYFDEERSKSKENAKRLEELEKENQILLINLTNELNLVKKLTIKCRSITYTLDNMDDQINNYLKSFGEDPNIRHIIVNLNNIRTKFSNMNDIIAFNSGLINNALSILSDNKLNKVEIQQAKINILDLNSIVNNINSLKGSLENKIHAKLHIMQELNLLTGQVILNKFTITEGFIKGISDVINQDDIATFKCLINNSVEHITENIIQLLDKISINTGSKIGVWYRNHLARKNYKDILNRIIPLSKDAYFYMTYIDPTRTTTSAEMKSFLALSSKDRRKGYFDQYKLFDLCTKNTISFYASDRVEKPNTNAIRLLKEMTVPDIVLSTLD